MNAGVVAVIVLVVIVLACFGLVAAGLLRRHQLRSAYGTFDASLRRPSGRWQLGVCRYKDNSLEWLRTFSVSPVPVEEYCRPRLDLIGWREPTEAERRRIQPGAVIGVVEHDGAQTLIALSRDAWAGLSSWVEAGPSRRVGNWH
ncbi:hypothetical protein GCM10011512_18860 [Tersicoccus solisilvae]|uniref:DUF2550 family protein n=1 Tax=Tersicoccus solisilvae TaxID=1882339 RepID=A0ABQ1P749_9MICC|nr:DUF2550 domain-containing protein [Tersicoccus solisilvae]GGC92002.1 hypothetical protein GCM10011512_18860 [Tersicoccus solisilvae]